MNSLTIFLNTLFIEPINLQLYKLALTHKSFTSNIESTNNERLEFLGDRVLGLSMARWLCQDFKDSSEGDLAKRQAVLVSKDTLLKIADDINLPEHLLVSKALKNSVLARVESLYANAVEALIAAIFLDLGFEKADEFIRIHWQKYMLNVQKPPLDSKSELQEWTQARGFPMPIYEIVDQDGPAHAPEFRIKVTVQGYDPEIVKAVSRRKGEHHAAKNLLHRILNQK